MRLTPGEHRASTPIWVRVENLREACSLEGAVEGWSLGGRGCGGELDPGTGNVGSIADSRDNAKPVQPDLHQGQRDLCRCSLEF